MRFLFLGDLMGRTGRTAAMEAIPDLKDRLKLDAVVVNGENAAAGFGLTGKIAAQLFEAGVDIISGGNHTFDQRGEITGLLESEPRVLRPVNYPPGTPGRGFHMMDAGRGRSLLVINAMGRVFMDPMDCPFRAVDEVLGKHRLGHKASAILIDFHGDATSEKMAMGHHADGRATLVVGTHSHIPTADAQILPGGTAYQTDAGMCGDYDSVIGMQKEEPLSRFRTKLNRGRFEPAKGEATVCGVFVESDDRTGLAKRIEPVRIGPRLANTVPTLD
ncbi:TIGR00282 family metallophosphoesterase [Yunchengibacter salinarum]|uniref:TIGR00282 family metallophosphoesterase n=1 Tax=Yunchengibacter salinarum TaxID=3133399 RepID=UPI0035B577E4